MAINLVSLVSQFLTPQMVGSMARALGVNEAVAQKLVAAAVPTILASLGTAAAAPGGAQKVSDTITNSDPDILTKLGQAASGGNARFLNEGANHQPEPEFEKSGRRRLHPHRYRVGFPSGSKGELGRLDAVNGLYRCHLANSLGADVGGLPPRDGPPERDQPG